MSRALASAVLALGLVACGDTSVHGELTQEQLDFVWVGAVGPSGPVPPSSAQPLFDQNVAPILSPTCAGSGCHSAPGSSPIRFLPAAAQDLYASVLQYSDKLVAGNFDKADAQMLTRVAGGHYTASYTPAEVALIQEWLDAEVLARVDMPGVPSVTRRMMSEMSGCMSRDDWNTEGVALAWALKETGEGRCQQCHVNGQGWLASQDSDRMFNILSGPSMNPATGGLMMEMYIAADLSDPAAPKLLVNRGLLERAGSGNAQHPTFEVDGDAMTRLQRFYFKTVLRRSTFQCDPPRFEP